MCHRVDIHEELKRVATATEGEGKAAVLKKSTRVVDVNTKATSVTLEDGSEIETDLILGADGASVSNVSPILLDVVPRLILYASLSREAMFAARRPNPSALGRAHSGLRYLVRGLKKNLLPEVCFPPMGASHSGSRASEGSSCIPAEITQS